MLEHLERIERRILNLEKLIMATLADIITALNDNTNAVATRIDALVAAVQATKLPDGSMVITADQVASISAVSDHLKQLGANPTNPIPPAFPAGSPDAAAAPAAAAQGPHVAPTSLPNDAGSVSPTPAATGTTTP